MFAKWAINCSVNKMYRYSSRNIIAFYKLKLCWTKKNRNFVILYLKYSVHCVSQYSIPYGHWPKELKIKKSQYNFWVIRIIKTWQYLKIMLSFWTVHRSLERVWVWFKHGINSLYASSNLIRSDDSDLKFCLIPCRSVQIQFNIYTIILYYIIFIFYIKKSRLYNCLVGSSADLEC